MAKQLLTSQVFFTPGASNAGILDFSNVPGFSIKKLYAVINVTRNTPIYLAGATGYGATTSATNINFVRIAFDTSTHTSNDILNVYYDVLPTDLSINSSLENGGQLQQIQETSNQMLAELRVLNYILATGLNISTDEVDKLRDDMQTFGIYPHN